jgi:tRNA A37 threonylcarbamoyladenosine modification protein TsaB
MSKVLAIDTSTARTSVAIIDGDTVLFSGYKDGATAHGPSLACINPRSIDGQRSK